MVAGLEMRQAGKDIQGREEIRISQQEHFLQDFCVTFDNAETGTNAEAWETGRQNFAQLRSNIEEFNRTNRW